MGDINEIQKASRAALNGEMNLCIDIAEAIKDVKIFANVKHYSGRIDTIDLVDYFTNFPFCWATEIKVLLSDAVEQYSELLKQNNNEH